MEELTKEHVIGLESKIREKIAPNEWIGQTEMRALVFNMIDKKRYRGKRKYQRPAIIRACLGAGWDLVELVKACYWYGWRDRTMVVEFIESNRVGDSELVKVLTQLWPDGRIVSAIDRAWPKNENCVIGACKDAGWSDIRIYKACLEAGWTTRRIFVACDESDYDLQRICRNFLDINLDIAGIAKIWNRVINDKSLAISLWDDWDLLVALDELAISRYEIVEGLSLANWSLRKIVSAAYSANWSIEELAEIAVRCYGLRSAKRAFRSEQSSVSLMTLKSYKGILSNDRLAKRCTF